LRQFETFFDGLKWRDPQDPLVIDLDGDGIETVRLSQSRAYFDHDDDFFAERTGWVSSNDGILAVDLEGDGLIDDIEELFGGNNAQGEFERGFVALSQYDDNADGVVDASDAGFADILVWRDLDGDGKGEGYASEGEGGELFTLVELGITSLGATGEDLIPTTGDPEAGRELASGARLLAQGTYTREDGSLGNLYEAVFETDTTRTIYRGEGGLTPFALLIQTGENAGNVVDATGRGRSTLLSIAASNDIVLSEVLTAQLVAAGNFP